MGNIVIELKCSTNSWFAAAHFMPSVSQIGSRTIMALLTEEFSVHMDKWCVHLLYISYMLTLYQSSCPYTGSFVLFASNTTNIWDNKKLANLWKLPRTRSLICWEKCASRTFLIARLYPNSWPPAPRAWCKRSAFFSRKIFSNIF